MEWNPDGIPLGTDFLHAMHHRLTTEQARDRAQPIARAEDDRVADVSRDHANALALAGPVIDERELTTIAEDGGPEADLPTHAQR
jgi:hypothetical protein